MPEYVCECCFFKTNNKPHFDRHNATKKHITLSANYNPVDKIINTFTDADAKVKIFEDVIAGLRAEVASLKEMVQMYREMLLVKPQTPTAIPQQISLPAPAPAPEQLKGETCNTLYIIKEMNTDENDAFCPTMDTFFSFNNETAKFNFDDICVDDLTGFNKKWVVEKIVEAMDNLMSQNILVPFRYHKSSWYIKQKNGWEKLEQPKNKNVTSLDEDKYNRDPIARNCFLQFNNRLVKHFDDTLGDAWRGPYGNCDYPLLRDGILNLKNYSNNDILTPLSQLFA